MTSEKKKKLLPFLFSGAEAYKKNLLDKSFLFIGQGARDEPPLAMECLFLAHNFMHLTGCEILGDLSPGAFFDRCLDRRLSPNAFDCISEAFLKKDVFDTVFSLPYSAKMIGSSSGGGNRLYTERLAGNVRGCMGFVLGDEAPCYSPNTVLKEDIRNMVIKPQKLLAVYGKPLGPGLYPHAPIKTAKELRGKALSWPPQIECLIAPANSDSP